MVSDLIKKKKLGEWHAYWLAEQILWFRSLGLDEIKIREHTKDELVFYSTATFDIDYLYPFGSREVAGNANRGQYDLKQHQEFSKQSMEIYDEKNAQNNDKQIIFLSGPLTKKSKLRFTGYPHFFIKPSR